jgi:hypothetical protein
MAMRSTCATRRSRPGLQLGTVRARRLPTSRGAVATAPRQRWECNWTYDCSQGRTRH